MAKRVGVDKWMFFTTLLLVVAGLAMVFSASAVVAQERYHSEFADVGRQAGWALAGVLALLVLMHVDVSVYKSPKFIYTALCVTTLLLVMVFFFPDSHNTHRWIRFGGHFTFQPSEIAKPVVVREVVGEVIVDVDREGEEEVPYESLYHATDSAGAVKLARGIDLTKGRKRLDFNPKNTAGFYVTKDYGQAQKWARKTQKQKGLVGSGIVVEYQVPTPDLEAHLYQSFVEVTEGWKDTVVKGRRNELLHKFSWVEGPMLLNPKPSIREGVPVALGGGHQIAIFNRRVVADWDGDQHHV